MKVLAQFSSHSPFSQAIFDFEFVFEHQVYGDLGVFARYEDSFLSLSDLFSPQSLDNWVILIQYAVLPTATP